MKRFLRSSLLMVWLAASLSPALAQNHTREVLTVDVPFKFNVKNRVFPRGSYQFVFAGNGLIVVRDAKAHAVASLMARAVETQNASPSSKLVFRHDKKREQLSQIWIENRTQFLEILGEEVAIRPSPNHPVVSPDFPSFGDRRPGLGWKH
jgi:hypothetical protein